MSTEALNVRAELRDLITPELAWRYKVVPFESSNEALGLWCTGEGIVLKQELEVILGKPVVLKAAAEEAIVRALGHHYRRAAVNSGIELKGKDTDSVLQDLVHEARALGSSDIHIESYDGIARVRIRIDGQLVERHRYDRNLHQGIVNRIKVQAGLDISEKRLPQDGRMILSGQQDRMDIRVSVLPTLHGEKAVLRLLGQDAGHLRIEDLGMDDRQLHDYRSAIHRPHGLILISGPTGSGKTTTLYATLKELNETKRNIVTVEDPIEYTLEGINQVQLREQIGLTFAQALRSFLRQDPDVIMLGEIRDADTANMAVRAALTGHLVLSTVHTNSAWGTIGRLTDMGVPPYLLASTLNLSVAQRLVRLLCPKCARIVTTTHDAEATQTEANKCREPVGCETCHYTGYSGRRAVYEVIRMDDELRALLRSSAADSGAVVRAKGIKSLAESGKELVHLGLTSIEEATPLSDSH